MAACPDGFMHEKRYARDLTAREIVDEHRDPLLPLPRVSWMGFSVVARVPARYVRDVPLPRTLPTTPFGVRRRSANTFRQASGVSPPLFFCPVDRFFRETLSTSCIKLASIASFLSSVSVCNLERLFFRTWKRLHAAPAAGWDRLAFLPSL